MVVGTRFTFILFGNNDNNNKQANNNNKPSPPFVVGLYFVKLASFALESWAQGEC